MLDFAFASGWGLGTDFGLELLFLADLALEALLLPELLILPDKI